MRKTIEFDLSAKSINSAIKELEHFQTDFFQKIQLLQERIANDIALHAQAGFNTSTSERSWVAGKQGTYQEEKPNVTVDINPVSMDTTVIVAHGQDAIWVEFGTGVYYYGSVGSSRHPKGRELGMTIGSYGKGNGRKRTWGYMESDEFHRTHGVPATMPMYNAMMDSVSRFYSIAKEVFG